MNYVYLREKKTRRERRFIRAYIIKTQLDININQAEDSDTYWRRSLIRLKRTRRMVEVDITI